MTSTDHCVTVVMFGDERLPDRFWRKVAVDASGCWLWTAALNHGGYGYYHLRTRGERGQAMHMAHRVVYEALVSSIPPSLPHVDHLCRVRACVNPAHLEPVTQAENNRRMMASLERVTHCVKGHAFTESNTYWRPSEPGSRTCKTCNAAAVRRYRARITGGAA